jgi:hypothetical protein
MQPPTFSPGGPPEANALPLSIELVPASCWYSNLRNAMSRERWDSLRHQVYAQYQHRCGVCGARPGRLECHEVWRYDDRTHVQTLDGFVALCAWCHHVKHIGLAALLADQGKLDYERVVRHFLRVNRCDRAAFQRHYAAAFAIWNERSRHEWSTDLGAYAALVSRALPPGQPPSA